MNTCSSSVLISRPFGRLIGVLALLLSLGLATVPVNAASHSKGDLRVYIFGHSLINDNMSGPSSVPYWMKQLALSDATTFRFAGQWGFLWQHTASFPPVSQWQFDGARSFWDDDLQSFAAANFNAILLTPANFEQHKHPTVDGYRGSPAGNALELIDLVIAEEPGIDIYIYENWPNMEGFLADRTFPPSPTEFAAYNSYALGEFSDWWVEYLQVLSSARPDVRIVSIPVGPTIAKMLTETSLLSGIPVTDLYYDDAPHGRPTIYFLASLVTYAGMYGRMPPESFPVPPVIHPVVRQNYAEIVSFVAREIGVD